MNALHCLVMILGATGWGADRSWRPEVFDYERPDRLEIAEQGEPADKLPETRQLELTFRNLRGETVPVLLTLPPKGKGPFPAVLLVHPLGGDRRQMTVEMGKALTSKGYACVALDLPLHGGRADKKGKPTDLFVHDDPGKTYKHILAVVSDIRQAIDLIKERRDLESDKGVPVIGYSMGAWFGTLAGSADRRVSMLILQGAGTGDPTAAQPRGLFKEKTELGVLRSHPTVRPEVAIAEFAPRPILMQNGKKDPFVSEESARSLYRVAKAPKEHRWYDAGHILPEKAATEATEWIGKTRAGN